MARKIVFAAYGFMVEGKALTVDRLVDVRWDGGTRQKVFWHGDTPGNGGRAIGHLPEPTDAAWMRKITDVAMETGRIEDVVGRIHEVDVEGLGHSPGYPANGFSIELLTGQDARDALSKRRDAIVKHNLKELWWLLPLGAVALWFFF